LRTLAFLFTLLLFIIACVLLPVTPNSSRSFLFAKIAKDSLLKNVPSPRIIFIGGSNLSYGLNSQMIKDSLNLNPINTALAGGIGLIYMLDHTLRYIKNGDKVIVVPEYQQFFGDAAYGGELLLRTTMDVSPSDITRLRKEQWANICVFFAKYALSKLNLIQYQNKQQNILYGKNSFNEFGDVDVHWRMKRIAFEPYGSIKESINNSVINELVIFSNKLRKKGATLFVGYPGYQDISFELSKEKIVEAKTALINSDLQILGTPERYKIADSLMFNSPYHLLKKGVDYRTRLFIEDFKAKIISLPL